MSNWIKLKKNSGTSINDFYIDGYNIDAIESTGPDSSRIWNYTGDTQYHMEVAESAEAVLAKIKKAEDPVDLSSCIVEHFTREEYELILENMKRLVNPSDSTKHIVHVIEAILEEYK